MMVFGPNWSRALCLGCSRLSALGHDVQLEWPLAMIALESAGTWDPKVLQGRARIVDPSGPNDMRPEIAGTGGKRLSHGSGARGLFQVMPDVEKREGLPPLMRLYAELDPLAQLAHKIRALVDWSIRHRVGGYKTRAALYCANLAPARLAGGAYDDDTILYSADPADAPMNDQPNGAKTFWPAGYRMNAAPFDLDPADPKGKLRMRHLDRGLDKAIAACRARYDAEVAAAYVANLR